MSVDHQSIGLYIHIPFCRKACTYCDFHFSTNLKKSKDIADAICKELRLQLLSEPWKNKVIKTIYFGGGTPSVLHPQELQSILNVVQSYGTFDMPLEKLECTLEANPEDITAEAVESWKAMGINRLSIGVQSFDESTLKWMNRAHSARRAIDAVHLSAKSELIISIDLIYGNPNQTIDGWQLTLEKALELPIQHMSCYMLTKESQTALDYAVQTGEIQMQDETIVARQFEVLQSMMKDKGWDPYEISNYCRPGFRAIHNSRYWDHLPYLGVGPSAHSFDGIRRLWNIRNNNKYLGSLNNGTIPFEMEILSNRDLFNESVMLGLRRNNGIEMGRLRSIDKEIFSQFWKQLDHSDLRFKLEIGKNRLTIRDEHKLWTDSIISALFIEPKT